MLGTLTALEMCGFALIRRAKRALESVWADFWWWLAASRAEYPGIVHPRQLRTTCKVVRAGLPDGGCESMRHVWGGALVRMVGGGES